MKRLFTYELNVSTFNVEQNQKQGNFKSMQAKLNRFKKIKENISKLKKFNVFIFINDKW